MVRPIPKSGCCTWLELGPYSYKGELHTRHQKAKHVRGHIRRQNVHSNAQAVEPRDFPARPAHTLKMSVHRLTEIRKKLVSLRLHNFPWTVDIQLLETASTFRKLIHTRTRTRYGTAEAVHVILFDVTSHGARVLTTRRSCTTNPGQWLVLSAKSPPTWSRSPAAATGSRKALFLI